MENFQFSVNILRVFRVQLVSSSHTSGQLTVLQKPYLRIEPKIC